MNGISQDSSLIIFKYEKKNVSANEIYIQCEVYDPNTYNKLDLSVCEDNINIYVPVVLNNEAQQIYNEIKDQEYDILDINSKFFTDICTPFTTDKNTDVLLVDRKNYYHSKIINEFTCPSNCKTLLYNSESNHLKVHVK